MSCQTSFMYPLSIDIYYPMVEQDGFGSVRKTWIYDKTVAAALNPAGRKYKEDSVPDPNITLDNSLVGSIQTDILLSTRNAPIAMTNVLITNIKGTDGSIIYNESSGVRSGQATIFEIATYNPIVGPFGKIEYYKIVLRRSDNQGVEI